MLGFVVRAIRRIGMVGGVVRGGLVVKFASLKLTTDLYLITIERRRVGGIATVGIIAFGSLYSDLISDLTTVRKKSKAKEE
jgi:hypothetical protein